MYESFYRTYQEMGYLISELSVQTKKTAAVEAERRAVEAEKIAKGSAGDDGDVRKLAAKEAATKRRQAAKFSRSVYVDSGGTARANAVPSYKSKEQKAEMDKAANERHPSRYRKGRPDAGTPARPSSETDTDRKVPVASKSDYSSKSAFGLKHYNRLKKRYGKK